MPAEPVFEWRGRFDSSEVDALHAEAFDHRLFNDDWWGQVNRHSLGWVIARQNERLVGFVNIAWDGAMHAFVLDTIVASPYRRAGIATRLVGMAVTGARQAGCEWLHVDFDDHLRDFYFKTCGFEPTNAGLVQL